MLPERLAISRLPSDTMPTIPISTITGDNVRQIVVGMPSLIQVADVLSLRWTVYFITSEYEKAAADYDKSIELDKDFVFSHVQKAVCEYKVGKVRESMVAFRKILKDFPQRSEPFNY